MLTEKKKKKNLEVWEFAGIPETRQAGRDLPSLSISILGGVSELEDVKTEKQSLTLLWTTTSTSQHCEIQYNQYFIFNFNL